MRRIIDPYLMTQSLTIIMMQSNIDRYLAIWQAIHPDSWFDGDKIEKLASQPLLPFISPKGQDAEGFWTSNSSRKTSNFGYTYEDVLDKPTETLSNFQEKYKWSLRPQYGHVDWYPVPPPSMVPLNLSRAQVYRGLLEYVPPKPPPFHIGGREKPTPLQVARAQTSTQEVTGASIKDAGTTTEQKVREWYVDDAVNR